MMGVVKMGSGKVGLGIFFNLIIVWWEFLVYLIYCITEYEQWSFIIMRNGGG